MSARRVPARDICKCKGHDIRPIERDNPANRADKAKVQITPAHTVRQGNRADEFGQHLREELRRLSALLVHSGIDIAVTLNERRRFDALPACKARACLRRIPLRIKGNGDRGTARLCTHILLPLGKPRHEERRTARRTDRPQTLIGDTACRQHVPRETFQISEEMRHDVCRNFLRPNFKKQILTHAFPSFFSIG